MMCNGYGGALVQLFDDGRLACSTAEKRQQNNDCSCPNDLRDGVNHNRDSMPEF